MKKLFTILAAVLLTAGVFAQSPEKMSYQAVIRNSSNALVTSTAVGVRISILQGSITGTEVYKEIYNPNPTTNANGLLTLEIGGGVPIIGTFAAINWNAGPYFLKTETDPTGGSNYTITGTSQLLSVPYAIHAKTAETLTGSVTETDPVFMSSQAQNITATDITHLSNLSGVNSGDQDLSSLATKIALDDSIAHVRSEIPPAANGSETKVTSGYGIVLSGAGTTASPYNISTPIPVILIPLAIGDSYQGGKIFWIDATGEHGLIAATTDIVGVQWYNGTNRYTGTSDGLYAGKMNTAMIVAEQMADNQTGFFAAKGCSDYTVSVAGGVTYGDWYLPSLYELNLLYAQRTVVGGFASNNYWSSSEGSDFISNARTINFSTGAVSITSKANTYRVRAIRAF